MKFVRFLLTALTISSSLSLFAQTKVQTITGALVELNKASVGLNNVDNTADLNKPISTAEQTALDLKENLANKSIDANLGTSDNLYPSQKAVKNYVDAKVVDGAANRIPYFTGTSSLGNSPTFTFSPTSPLSLNNSVTAAGGIANGTSFTPTLTAAANNDILSTINVNPTFSIGSFTGVSRLGLRIQNSALEVSSDQSVISNFVNISATQASNNIKYALSVSPSTRDFSIWDVTNSVDKLRLNNNGDVGFNGAAVNYSGYRTLTFNGNGSGAIINMTVNGSNAFRFFGAFDGSYLIESRAKNIFFATNNVGRGRFESTGEFVIAAASEAIDGIGVTLKPTGLMTINSSGTSTATAINFKNGNGIVGSVSTNGSATTFNTSSDYRLKTDFRSFDGLSLINEMKIYDFQWKSDLQRNYGVKAHELQAVIPYAVVGEKDGVNFQQVDYSKIVPVNTKAIQELAAQLVEKQEKIDNLETRIAALEQFIKSLAK